METLSGKIAIVTGGNSGMGLAVAQAMASDNQSAVYPVVANLARENNLELFYDQISASRVPAWNPEEFVRWWFYGGGRSPQHHESFWAGFDPMYFVLPLLGVFGSDPRKFMQVLVGTPPGNWIECALGGHTPAAVVGGAILGAIDLARAPGRRADRQRAREFVWALPRSHPV